MDKNKKKEQNFNIEQRLSYFLNKNIETEQLYFTIHRVLLVIFIILIIGMSL